MGSLRLLLIAAVLLVAVAPPLRADTAAVASIRPIHSLVAAVMSGRGEPTLIVEGAGSPHSASLKPSQARSLQQADVVFWVGPELEAFLEKPIATLASGARVVALLEAQGLNQLAFRQGGAFRAGDDGDGHGHHAGINPHVWLDPWNAKILVQEIVDALVAVDPENAAIYVRNAAALTQRLDRLTAEIQAILAPVKDKPFVVFHDAYPYFEARFGLVAAGSISVSPEVLPGAERIAEIKAMFARRDATCVFTEPQFTPKLVAAVTEGTRAKSGVLDPLGSAIKSGPEHYFQMMRNLALAFRDCLSSRN